MDIGIFRRTKGVFIAWTFSPILLVIIVQLGSIYYCMRANRLLSRNKDMLEAINGLHESVSRSDAAITSADKGHKAPVATHEVSRWINDIASLSDFAIETLSVDTAGGVTPPDPQPGIKAKTQTTGDDESVPSIIITLKGHGKYLSVTRFVRDIESCSPLIQVQNIDVTEEVYGKTDVYRCNLVFSIYIIKS